MLAQCREKGGSARGVRSKALQSICDRGEDTYEGFVGIEVAAAAKFQGLCFGWRSIVGGS